MAVQQEWSKFQVVGFGTVGVFVVLPTHQLHDVARVRFWLTIDASLDSKIEVPWPFYRVEPFEARPCL